MKRTLIAAAVAAAFAAPSVWAGPISTLASWGVNTAVIDGANDVAASNYATTPGAVDAVIVEDTSSGGYVGPAYGGQRYDVEALYVRQTDTTLQVAGITGALWDERPGGATGLGPNNPNFGIGDLFLGQRATGSPDGNTFGGFAVELTGAHYTIDSSGHTSGFALKPLGAIYSVSAATGYNDGIAYSRGLDPSAAPGQIAYDAAGDGLADGTPESAATLVSGFAATVEWEQFLGDRHSAFFLEFDLAAIAPLLIATDGDIMVHWGEVCVNDYLETEVTVFHDDHHTPTPSSLALLLAGLFGACVLRRRV